MWKKLKMYECEKCKQVAFMPARFRYKLPYGWMGSSLKRDKCWCEKCAAEFKELLK